MEYSFNWKDTIMEKLGIEMAEYTKERVSVTMPVRPGTYQPFGLLHGGISVVMAETVASAGTYLFIDRNKQRAMGLEINANHLRSVKEGLVKAVGVPVHSGHKTMVWDVRIYDQDETLFCISRCTMAILDITDGNIG